MAAIFYPGGVPAEEEARPEPITISSDEEDDFDNWMPELSTEGRQTRSRSWQGQAKGKAGTPKAAPKPIAKRRCIVIFDSLGHARPTAATKLRKYGLRSL